MKKKIEQEMAQTKNFTSTCNNIFGQTRQNTRKPIFSRKRVNSDFTSHTQAIRPACPFRALRTTYSNMRTKAAHNKRPAIAGVGLT